MRPEELYTISGSPALDSIVLFAGRSDVVEGIRALGPTERAAVGGLATLLVSVAVLGMVHGYGKRTVTKCRRSPVISACLGFPSVFVVGLFFAAGYVMLGTEVGVFFGVPLVVLGVTVLPVVTAIGFVAFGQSIAARLGRNRLWAGIIVGSLVAGLAATVVPIAAVAGTIAAGFGMGASVRVLAGSRGSKTPDERTVPPANQI